MDPTQAISVQDPKAVQFVVTKKISFHQEIGGEKVLFQCVNLDANLEAEFYELPQALAADVGRTCRKCASGAAMSYKNLALRCTAKHRYTVEAKTVAAIPPPPPMASNVNAVKGLSWDEVKTRFAAGRSDFMYFVRNSPYAQAVIAATSKSLLEKTLKTSLDSIAKIVNSTKSQRCFEYLSKNLLLLDCHRDELTQYVKTNQNLTVLEAKIVETKVSPSIVLDYIASTIQVGEQELIAICPEEIKAVAFA